MSSVPVQGKRLLRLSGLEEWELRFALMRHFRASQRYKNAVAQDVRPKWQALGADNVPTFGRWQELTWREDCPRAVRAYVDAVTRLLATFGLLHHNEPAEWAGEYVHADAARGVNGPFDPGGAAMSPLSSFAVKLEVSATGAELRLVQEVTVIGPGPLRQTHQEDRDLVPPVRVEADRFLGFDEWKSLEREAQALVSAGFAAVRADWRQPRQGLYRNSGTPEQQQEYARILFEYLANGIPVDHSQQRTIKDIAEIVGLDFPKGAEKQRQK